MIVGQSAAPHERETLYADVIVPRHLEGPFTYLVPSRLQPSLRIGQLVLVPFGRSMVQGAVVSLANRPPHGFETTRLKEISNLLSDDVSSDLPAALFELSKWVAEQYVAPWGQCLRLVLPPTVNPTRRLLRYRSTQPGRIALALQQTCSQEVRSILAQLESSPSGLPRSRIEHRQSHEYKAALQWLLTEGWIVEEESPRQGTEQSSLLGLHVPQADPHDGRLGGLATNLSGEQQAACRKEFSQALHRAAASRILLQAPWFERSALLCQTVQEVLELGKTVLVIVGEAERAEWIARSIREQDPDVSASCFHSGLPDHVRAELWQQIDRRRVRVVVGTRSAIFLPLRDIGMIWVEGEEDSALKEPQEPHYHARNVAWFRAQAEQALLVLSSAHPCLETQVTVESNGRLLHVSRSADTAPAIQLVDLRGQGRENVLTPPLVQALRDAVAKRAGAILFLNRKYYAGALVCRDCGQIPRCPICSVAFTYSRLGKQLLCAYCGGAAGLSDICSACSGPRLYPIGEGTERVEEEARRLFPHAAILRIDGETMRRPRQARALWRLVSRREWDVLVGTQALLGPMLERSAGVVGIVHADSGLSIPDFRAAERTYHQLLDAVDLARPAAAGGQVIVQTYLPTHHAIRAVVQRDESIFSSEEQAQRTALGYPPLVHLVVLHISGLDDELVKEASARWMVTLTALAKGVEGLTVLGPAPSPIPRLRGRHRRQILVKSRDRAEGIQAAHTTIRLMERASKRRAVKFDVDVDPIDLW